MSLNQLSRLFRLVAALLILSSAIVAVTGSSIVSYAQEGETLAQEGETFYETGSETFVPEPESVLLTPHPKLTTDEYSQLLRRIGELREMFSAPYNIDTSDFVGEIHPEPAEEMTAGEAVVIQFHGTPSNQFHGTPSNFVIPSNVFNTQADNPGNNSLAEPVGANEGPNIFYAGNNHSEFSTNGGLTWTDVPLIGGPGDAPLTCCDWDVVYDQARGVTFISTLYVNSAGNNGVVRIFVRRDISQPYNCLYTIDPAGAANDTVPDYPHINISNDFLYLTTVNFGGAAGGRTQVRRFNIDQMADCDTVSSRLFQYVWNQGVGLRVFVPIEGARETMFWFMHEDADTLRIFRWPETSLDISSVLRDVAASTFGVNVDCSGGVGNNDWWEFLSASILGWHHRGAFGSGRLHLYGNAAPDAIHTQGHIHGAIFAVNAIGADQVVGNRLAQPVIFNNSFCFGWPHVSANERGDIGMMLAFGGNAGGGGAAAQPAVGIDDDFTSALGGFEAAGGFNFNTFAAGTHNRPDEQFGDYFNIHPHEPCDLMFGATGYALFEGFQVTNVNARWVEFGRQRDAQCYSRWDDEDPVP